MATARNIADVLGNPPLDQSAQVRMVQAHDKARAVPKYVRAAVNALDRYARPPAAAPSATSAATWEPQFDCMTPGQEELVMEFCLEIAGRRGEPGRAPDPVRLLEMAQALYEVERAGSQQVEGESAGGTG